MSMLNFLDDKDALRSMSSGLRNITDTISNDTKWGFDKDWEDFILGMTFMNPQAYGIRIQNRLIAQMEGLKVKAKDNAGDFVDISGKAYECKTSILTRGHSQFHVVQIRPWQGSDYYCVLFDIRTEDFKAYCFKLTSEEMKKELLILNATAAHGTSSANRKNTNIEYRFSMSVSDESEHFQRWKNNYSTDFDFNSRIDINELLEKERLQSIESRKNQRIILEAKLRKTKEKTKALKK